MTFPRSILTAFLLLCLAGGAAAQDVPADPSEAPSEQTAKPAPARLTPRALSATMLDLAARGDVVLAVGERGIVLRSGDGGKTWKQMPSPADVTLTGVSFASDQKVWAVGHESTILASQDAGQSWSVARFEAAAGNYYLDVNFLDAAQGYVLGANGELWRTADGGAHWDVTVLAADEFVQNHLFGLAVNGERSLVAAEKGALFMRPSPDSPDWTLLESPYNGSFFGVLPLGERFLVFGMSGKAFIGPDAQRQYQEVPTGTRQFLLAGTLLADGSALLGGRGGVLLHVDTAGTVIERTIRRGHADILALEIEGQRAFIATSRGGVEEVALPELFAPASAPKTASR